MLLLSLILAFVVVPPLKRMDSNETRELTKTMTEAVHLLMLSVAPVHEGAAHMVVPNTEKMFEWKLGNVSVRIYHDDTEVTSMEVENGFFVGKLKSASVVQRYLGGIDRLMDRYGPHCQKVGLFDGYCLETVDWPDIIGSICYNNVQFSDESFSGLNLFQAAYIGCPDLVYFHSALQLLHDLYK